MKVKVAQSCLTLCSHTVHGTLQARILEWVAFPLSRGSFQPRDNPGLLLCGWILYQLSYKGSPRILERVADPFSSRSSWPRNQTRVSCIARGFFTNWAIREAPSQNGYFEISMSNSGFTLDLQIQRVDPFPSSSRRCPAGISDWVCAPVVESGTPSPLLLQLPKLEI